MLSYSRIVRDPTPQEYIPTLRELLSYDALCPHCMTFARNQTGSLVQLVPPSPLHWSRQTEWPWAILEGDLLPTHHCLDIGSGWSVLKYALAQRTAHVTCVDNDYPSIEKASQTTGFFGLKNITHTYGDARDLSYADATFDRIFCFPKGTIVAGSGKAIEDLRIGDEVYGSSGRKQKVLQTFQRIYSGEIINLKIGSLPPVSVTPHHKILVSNVTRVHRSNKKGNLKAVYEYVPSISYWKEAKDLEKGDWVSIPRREETRDSQLFFIKGRQKKEISVPVDSEIAWLLGAYTAEGHTSYPKGKENWSGRATFSLGSHEGEFALRIKKALSRFDLKGNIYTRKNIPNWTGLRIHVGGFQFCKILDSWCGKGAKNKRVPDCIQHGSEEVIRGFISGLQQGDGCKYKDKSGKRSLVENTIATVSPVLAYGVLELLHKLNVYGSIFKRYQSPGEIEGIRVKPGWIYIISWSQRSWDKEISKIGRIPFGKTRFIGSNIFMPIKGISKKKVRNLPVFNIHTQDETYGIPFTVHNCISVVEHIPDSHDQVFKEVKRLLRPGGIAMISLDVAIEEKGKTNFFVDRGDLGRLLNLLPVPFPEGKVTMGAKMAEEGVQVFVVLVKYVKPLMGG